MNDNNCICGHDATGHAYEPDGAGCGFINEADGWVCPCTVYRPAAEPAAGELLPCPMCGGEAVERKGEKSPDPVAAEQGELGSKDGTCPSYRPESISSQELVLAIRNFLMSHFHVDEEDANHATVVIGSLINRYNSKPHRRKI